MNNIQNWLNDLTKISENKALKIEIEKFKPIQLVEETEYLDHLAVQKKMVEMGEITGWVQETSKVHRLNQQLFKATSFILNAEWTAKGYSFSVEHLGKNQWLFKQYHLKASELEDATHLAERFLHCEVGKNHKSFLVYQRLWQDQQNTPVANTAVFSGFQE